MPTVETRYIRCGSKITDISDPTNPQVKDHGSINAAKRESRRLQGSTPGLGLVHVEPHKKRRPDWSQRKSPKNPVSDDVVDAIRALVNSR